MNLHLLILSFVFVATFGQNAYAGFLKSRTFDRAIETVKETVHDTAKNIGDGVGRETHNFCKNAGEGTENFVRTCRDDVGDVAHNTCKSLGQGTEKFVRNCRDEVRRDLKPLGEIVHKVCRESGEVGHDVFYIAGKGVESAVRDLKTPQGALRFAVVVGMTFVPGVGPLALIAINTGTGTLLSFTQPGQPHTLESLGKTIAINAATSTAGVLVPSGGRCLTNAIGSAAASSASSNFANSVASQYVYNHGEVNFGDALKSAGQGAVVGAVGGFIDHQYSEVPSKTTGQFCHDFSHNVVRGGATGAVNNLAGQMIFDGKISDWKQAGQQGFHDGAQGGIDWGGQRLAHHVVDSLYSQTIPSTSNEESSEKRNSQDYETIQDQPIVDSEKQNQDESLDHYTNKLKKILEKKLEQKNLNNLTLDDAIHEITKSTKAEPDQTSIQKLKTIEKTQGREKAIEIAKNLAIEARATNETRRIQRQINQTKKTNTDFSDMFPSVGEASKNFPERQNQSNKYTQTTTTNTTSSQQHKGFLDQANDKFCFVANTYVLTMDGYKPIQEIEPGEKVLSCQFDNGQNVCDYDDIKEVITIGSRSVDRIVKIKFDDGQIIKSTPEHPYFVIESKSWIPAEELIVDDRVLTHDGKTVTIIKTKSIDLKDKPEAVYNIEIEDNNNFYISCKKEKDTDGILVHNCNFQKNHPVMDQVLDFAPVYPLAKDVQTIFIPKDCQGQPISHVQKALAAGDVALNFIPGGNIANKGVRTAEKAVMRAEIQGEKKALQKAENALQHKIVPNPKPNPPSVGQAVKPSTNKAPDFIIGPKGTAYPMPKGATGPEPLLNNAGKQTGVKFEKVSGNTVTRVRVMDPVPPRGKAPAYPDGYIKYEKQMPQGGWQGIDPRTGKPGRPENVHFNIE